MSKINKEIEEMAEKMQKSIQSPKEGLFKAIRDLGKDGLKEKMAILSDEDKVVLKAALEEMNLQKAVSFDDVYAAKMIQGKVTDTVIQEDIASDDADEKLVKPAAAAMSHQGTPTEGWSGQVIKALEDDDEQLDQLIEKAMAKCDGDDKIVMKKLKEKGMAEGKVQGALDKYKQNKDMKKSQEDIEKGKMSEKEAKDKIMAMEKKEHGTKDPKKLVDAEKKENAMKKSDEEIEKAVQTEIEPSEVNQNGDAPDLKGGKTVAKKTAAPDIEDNAKANKKNMTKSITWEDETRLLKANTQGRNFNFNVENFITETIASEGQIEEVIQKSEDTEDLNDLIQKGMDKNWDQVKDAKSKDEAKKKQNGKMVKSFDELTDLAESMGITEEEARKILGE